MKRLVIVAALSLMHCSHTDAPPGPASGSGTATTATTPVSSSADPMEFMVRSAAMAPYWHEDLPGRVPLRIVENPSMSKPYPQFQMFGVPVQWITAADAKDGTAFLTVDVTLQDGLLYLRVSYPIEGVVARGGFLSSQGQWSVVEEIRVVEE